MRKLNVIIIKRLDRATLTCELRTISDDIKEFYRLIVCDHIDIVLRVFNGVIFDIILDDEGLLKANETGELPTSWWQREGYTPNHEGLFGTLLLCHHDEQGDLVDATLEDLQAVQACYHVIPTKRGDLGLLFHDIDIS